MTPKVKVRKMRLKISNGTYDPSLTGKKYPAREPASPTFVAGQAIPFSQYGEILAGIRTAPVGMRARQPVQVASALDAPAGYSPLDITDIPTGMLFEDSALASPTPLASPVGTEVVISADTVTVESSPLNQ